MSAGVQIAGEQIGVIVLFAVAAAAAAPGQRKQASPGDTATVVFVCLHGNAKSLIASQWFNRLAGERGVAVRAVSRSVTPETPVPATIVEQLGRDGFDVSRFEPLALSSADLDGALRVVMIGVAPPAGVGGKPLSVESWEGIPPATERYEASRDAMRDRIVALLETLVRREGER